jgi:hypothetical protein
MNTAFVCVYRKGADFDEQYPLKLYEGLIEHNAATAPDFFCLTSEEFDAPFQCIPLIYDLPGWWNKMELYRKDMLQGYDRILYMDLDVLIRGDISALIEYNATPILSLRGFKHDNLSSSIMSFDRSNEDLNLAFDAFMRDPERFMAEFDSRRGAFGGDQAFIGTFIEDRWEAVQDIQEGVVSYKHHVQGKSRDLSEFNIINFHGRPRPHEVRWLQW